MIPQDIDLDLSEEERKIRDLVNAGAIVVGPKPVDSPSNSDEMAPSRRSRTPPTTQSTTQSQTTK